MKTLENLVPPPIVALAFATLIGWVADYMPMIEIEYAVRIVIVSLFVAMGAFFDLSGMVSFHKARTTVNPMNLNKTSALVNTGIYKITRNPMYVGLVFFLSAWCIYLASPPALISMFFRYDRKKECLPVCLVRNTGNINPGYVVGCKLNLFIQNKPVQRLIGDRPCLIFFYLRNYEVNGHNGLTISRVELDVTWRQDIVGKSR